VPNLSPRSLPLCPLHRVLPLSWDGVVTTTVEIHCILPHAQAWCHWWVLDTYPMKLCWWSLSLKARRTELCTGEVAPVAIKRRWMVVGMLFYNMTCSYHRVTWTRLAAMDFYYILMLSLAGFGFKYPGDIKKGLWSCGFSFASTLSWDTSHLKRKPLFPSCCYFFEFIYSFQITMYPVKVVIHVLKLTNTHTSS
jgi:hypothetical protein